MAAPYSSQTISGYNSNPPADDGSAVASNQIKWSGVKTKIGDPIKTRTDSMDSAIIAGFAKILGANAVSSTSIDYTVVSADQGKLIKAAVSGITITTPDATDVGRPFSFAVLNNTSGSITIDGSGTQTIDGNLTISVPTGAGVTIETDGTNWFTHGQDYIGTISEPQGRLTLTTGLPVLTTDVTAGTAVYYTPYVGNLVPIYNGTLFQMRTFAELTLTLSSNSNYAASSIYDIFVFDSSGAVTIGIGPAWSTATAGSGARGTGAGTTELERKLGLYVNKNSMTARNAGSTYTVAADQGTYVGSIFMDATNGQVSVLLTFGTNRKNGIWNMYNRVPFAMQAGDSTATWTYASATWRESRGQTTNLITAFAGIAADVVTANFAENVTATSAASQTDAQIGIGINSTTVASGFAPLVRLSYNATSVTPQAPQANLTTIPALGINQFVMLESTTAGSAIYSGTQANMQLTVSGRY